MGIRRRLHGVIRVCHGAETGCQLDLIQVQLGLLIGLKHLGFNDCPSRH